MPYPRFDYGIGPAGVLDLKTKKKKQTQLRTRAKTDTELSAGLEDGQFEGEH